MKKTFICLISIIFLVSGCFLEVHKPKSVKHFDYEFSQENIKTNEPVEMTVRWCPNYFEDDILISIKKLDNVEMELVEGKLYETDSSNAMFVWFYKPAGDLVINKATPYEQRPYFKLRLTFKKPGSYELRFIRTNESILDSNFEDGYMYRKIKVQE